MTGCVCTLNEVELILLFVLFVSGVSTFIGVIVTAFSTSELFKIFFKMVFGIVALGLIHGLVFLPVLLAGKCSSYSVVVC